MDEEGRRIFEGSNVFEVASSEWGDGSVIVMPPAEYTGRAPDLGAFEKY